MSGSLSDLQNLHESQIRGQQAYFDQQRAELKRLSAEREKKRRELNAARGRAQQRTMRKLKIANLKNAIIKKRADLNARGIQVWHAPKPGEPVPDGAKLAGMEIKDGDPLPPPSVLRSWINALNEVNEKNAKRLAELQSRNWGHECTAKRIVSMCTGVDEAQLDEAAPRLMTALESEGDQPVDLEKLRQFLLDVEGI